MVSGMSKKGSFSHPSLNFCYLFSQSHLQKNYHHLRSNKASKNIFLPRKENVPHSKHSLGGILENAASPFKEKGNEEIVMSVSP